MMAEQQDPALAGHIGKPGRETPEGIIVFDPILDAKSRIADHATVAQIAAEEYEKYGREHANACYREMEFEADRAAKKQDAVLRLVQQVNPASGEKAAKYSATAAESAAALDHEYRAHLQLQAETVVEKHLYYTKAQTARMRFELALAMLRAEAKIL